MLLEKIYMEEATKTSLKYLHAKKKVFWIKLDRLKNKST